MCSSHIYFFFFFVRVSTICNRQTEATKPVEKALKKILSGEIHLYFDEQDIRLREYVPYKSRKIF